jgi:DNA-binding MarR family transcriptional regulator
MPKTRNAKSIGKAVDTTGHFRLDLETFVPYRISILATLIRHALSEIYRDDPGLTEPEWRVFTTLAHMGPLPSGDIGLHMTLDRMAISRALSRLIELKLAARVPLERDGRMTEVNLTPHGSKVFDGLARQATAIEQIILAPLDQTQVATFLDLIDKIEKNFRAYGSSRRPSLIATAKAISNGAPGNKTVPPTSARSARTAGTANSTRSRAHRQRK